MCIMLLKNLLQHLLFFKTQYPIGNIIEYGKKFENRKTIKTIKSKERYSE